MTTDLTVNPQSGERLRWHVTAAESGGRLARLELWCPPGGGVLARHVHPVSTESFEVVDGRLRVELDGTEHVVGPGEHVDVPPGAVHRWVVAPGEEAHLFVEVSDPGAFEEQIETLFAAGRRGMLKPGGVTGLLMGLAIAGDHLRVGHLASPPLPVQRALVVLLRPVLRLTGTTRRVAACRAEARARLARRSPVPA